MSINVHIYFPVLCPSNRWTLTTHQLTTITHSMKIGQFKGVIMVFAWWAWYNCHMACTLHNQIFNPYFLISSKSWEIISTCSCKSRNDKSRGSYMHENQLYQFLTHTRTNCQKGQEMRGIVITRDSLCFLLVRPGVSLCLCVCTYVYVHLFVLFLIFPWYVVDHLLPCTSAGTHT